MSDTTPAPTGSLGDRPAHRCFVCRSGDAGFGFTTRAGMVWTCFAHRGDGEQRHVPPPIGSYTELPDA